ncbi:MAG TPA: hypothetical protein VF177_09655, partial [Anaerolineae bacterium]
MMSEKPSPVAEPALSLPKCRRSLVDLTELKMALYLVNLDERTRQLMLEEVEYDVARNQLHISPYLSGQGQHDYENLLRQAIEHGDEETL